MKRRAVTKEDGDGDSQSKSYTGLHVRAGVRSLWEPYGVNSSRECTALLICGFVICLFLRQAVGFLATLETRYEAPKGLFGGTFVFFVIIGGLLLAQDCWADGALDTAFEGEEVNELDAEEEALMKDLETGGEEEADGA